MRLLGDPAPNTEEGTITGHAIAAPATAAELFKNSLRLTVAAFLLLLFVIVSVLFFEYVVSLLKSLYSQAAKCRLVTVSTKGDIIFLSQQS
jgi:hypothetical protein